MVEITEKDFMRDSFMIRSKDDLRLAGLDDASTVDGSFVQRVRQSTVKIIGI